MENNHELIILIACGGRSSRMGTDKSHLQYYDKPHLYYLYDLLREICYPVFLSCNRDQAATLRAGYDFITDDPDFLNAGPLTATLSALKKFPGRDIMLLGVDYPWLDKNEILRFLDFISAIRKPAAFYDIIEKIYIPVLGYYPACCDAYILKWETDPSYSLQKLLKETNAVKYIPANPKSIISVDNKEGFEAFMKQASSG